MNAISWQYGFVNHTTASLAVGICCGEAVAHQIRRLSIDIENLLYFMSARQALGDVGNLLPSVLLGHSAIPVSTPVICR